jgi:hypothetical protein
MCCTVCALCTDVCYRFLEVKELVDEDVVALMYEFEMDRDVIESYKEGMHADLMGMAQSFLDLSTYSFQSTMGVSCLCFVLAVLAFCRALFCLFVCVRRTVCSQRAECATPSTWTCLVIGFYGGLACLCRS